MNLGDAGARWLARLPADVEAVCRTWGVAPGATLPSSWSLVVAATAADGSGVVVKLGFPDEESAHEAEALHEYDGEGAVRLLASDGSRRALLLERVTPGDSLDQLPDERLATSHAAAVLRRLWRPPPGDHSFGSTTDLARRWAVEVPAAYEARGGPFERRLVTAAAGLLGDLVRDPGAPVLLHRDAHYANILYSGSQGWLAIDPKGLVGDRELDTVPLLRNRLDEVLTAPSPRRRLAARVDQLAEECGLDVDRVRAWALAEAVVIALEPVTGAAPDVWAAEVLETGRLLLG